MKKLSKQKWKRVDILVLILCPLIAAVFSLLSKANYLVSTLLFYGLPALYLSFRTKDAVTKTFLVSLLFAISGTLFLDYFGVINQAWSITHTVFPSKVFGIVLWEDFLWAFLLTYAVIIFYEHFLDKGRHNLKISNIKYLILVFVSTIIIFVFLFLLEQSWLRIPYFYLTAGTVLLLLPSVIFLNFFPKLLTKFLFTMVYFFCVSFIFQITALTLGQWEYPGNEFIGYIQIFNYSFPLEEVIFWFVLVSVAILSYYEFLADDRK